MTKQINEQEYSEMETKMVMTIYETEKYELCYYPDEVIKIIIIDYTGVECKHYLLSDEDSKLLMAECLLYKMDDGLCIPDICADEEEAVETLIDDIVENINKKKVKVNIKFKRK